MSRLLAALLLLLFSTNSDAAQRIIVLAPAAADIIEKLDAAAQVVGKTRNIAEFPEAKMVGTHIRPNLEIITSLRPDLLVISSNRFFSQEMAAAVDADILYYNPNTLAEILEQIEHLAKRLNKSAQGQQLIAAQRQKLTALQPVAKPPRVIYEVTEIPLTIAGSKNIVSDIIASAGGQLVTGGSRKLLRFNPEGVLALQPDIYLWQVGPMNQNPTPPAARGQYRLLQSDYLQVEQLQYSRANSHSFDNVLELNRYFRQKQ